MRRYECQRCFAVMVVVPTEVAPRRHYTGAAIALALALYGLSGDAHAEVRRRVCPSQIVGGSAQYRWVTLTRWIDAVAARELFVSLPAMPESQSRRHVAGRAAMAIGAHAPPLLQAGAPVERAFAGAAHMA